MRRDTFEDCFTWLEKYYGSRQPAVARERYWEEFSGISDELFTESINTITRKRGAAEKFPAIDDINKAIAEAREALWHKTKASEPKAPLTRPKLRTEYAADGFKAIWDVFNGKPYEAVAEVMDARWPGRGWKEAMSASPSKPTISAKTKAGKWIQ